jgi:4-amino-4-deoxy-L-arabinose transferase-like glycosyltransferase
MRALVIGLLAAAFLFTVPNSALAAAHSKHSRHHAVRRAAQRHHWFWQHWNLHLPHHKSK